MVLNNLVGFSWSMSYFYSIVEAKNWLWVLVSSRLIYVVKIQSWHPISRITEILYLVWRNYFNDYYMLSHIDCTFVQMAEMILYFLISSWFMLYHCFRIYVALLARYLKFISKLISFVLIPILCLFLLGLENICILYFKETWVEWPIYLLSFQIAIVSGKRNGQWFGHLYMVILGYLFTYML